VSRGLSATAELLVLKYVYNIQPTKNKDNLDEKVIMMQIIMMQRSTEQRSAVDSRRCLTNFKMLVSHSV